MRRTSMMTINVWPSRTGGATDIEAGLLEGALGAAVPVEGMEVEAVHAAFVEEGLDQGFDGV